MNEPPVTSYMASHTQGSENTAIFWLTKSLYIFFLLLLFFIRAGQVCSYRGEFAEVQHMALQPAGNFPAEFSLQVPQISTATSRPKTAGGREPAVLEKPPDVLVTFLIFFKWSCFLKLQAITYPRGRQLHPHPAVVVERRVSSWRQLAVFDFLMKRAGYPGGCFPSSRWEQLVLPSSCLKKQTLVTI